MSLPALFALLGLGEVGAGLGVVGVEAAIGVGLMGGALLVSFLSIVRLSPEGVTTVSALRKRHLAWEEISEVRFTWQGGLTFRSPDERQIRLSSMYSGLKYVPPYLVKYLPALSAAAVQQIRNGPRPGERFAGTNIPIDPN